MREEKPKKGIMSLTREKVFDLFGKRDEFIKLSAEDQQKVMWRVQWYLRQDALKRVFESKQTNKRKIK